MSDTDVARTAHNALLRPVRAGNTFEQAVERILSMIRLGVVAVDEQLPTERELALRLGISRDTVQQALRALQEAGYVESRRGRYGGTFVRSTRTPRRREDPRRIARAMGDDLEDALVFRQVVEVGAAERAASRRLRTTEVMHLEQMLDQTSAAPLFDYRRADSRLHLAIAELSGSHSVTGAIADNRMRINLLLDAIPLLQQNIANSDDQHAAVVAAVLAGRPTKARRAMTEHVEGTASLLRAFLD